MKKKVGLLVDSLVVSKQIFELVELSKTAQNYEITTIVINRTDFHKKNLLLRFLACVRNKGASKIFPTILFRIVCFIESIILTQRNPFQNFFSKLELSEKDFEIIAIKPKISKSGLVYLYGKSDIEKIRSADLDLLIRAGSGILKGEILEVCPNGIISFHHGDNNLNRGTPAGFWEVYQENPRTGFVIQRLREELDGGDVLYKGSIATSWVYTLNLMKLYEISYPFLHRVIDDITSENPTLRPQEKVPYGFILFKNPTTIQTINYIAKTTMIFLRKLIRKTCFRGYRWNVAYQFVDNWNDITLWRSAKIQNTKNHFLADPFLISRNKSHYCFMEEYDYKSKRGVICVYEINKNITKNLGHALVEDFHLSYPYLFEYEQQLFMCPETAEKHEIRLYKCEDFPLRWRFYKTIMRNVSAADSMIFSQTGQWWLFTNMDKSSIGDHGSQLHIFYSSNPLSDNWSPLKDNPVIFDPRYARNGGLIQDNTGTYRVFQKQGFDLYGAGFGVAKIEMLNKRSYKEKTLFDVKPEFFAKIQGTHTFNYCDGLAVFDYANFSSIKSGARFY